MSFQWPLVLLALALVPAAAAAYVLWDRRRPGTASRFASAAMLPNVIARAPGRLRHVPMVLFLLALTALVTGFARPHATISVPREEATVVLALDVSRSMTATDVTPTRLGAAQAAAARFLERVPDELQVGIVTFASRANVIAPPTQDRDAALAALREIRPGEGTALSEAILLSLRAIRGAAPEDGEPVPASILLLSDGAQTVGEVTPAEAASRARRAGVPIHGILLGTAEGVVERQIPGGYTERTRVPPDPDALRQVAQVSGGELFTAADEESLKRVYDELGSRLGHRDKNAEVTVAFAGAGMLLFLAGGALSSLLLRRLP